LECELIPLSTPGNIQLGMPSEFQFWFRYWGDHWWTQFWVWVYTIAYDPFMFHNQ